MQEVVDAGATQVGEGSGGVTRYQLQSLCCLLSASVLNNISQNMAMRDWTPIVWGDLDIVTGEGTQPEPGVILFNGRK